MLENATSRIRNHRKEIELALAGGAPNCVPFTFYDLLFPEGFDPAPLQSKGMALCARRSVYRKITPNVKVSEVTESDGAIRTIYSTPVGTLTSLYRPADLAYGVVGSLGRRGVPIVPQDPHESGIPSWPVGARLLERPIKTRDDYRVAKFIVEDARYEQDYDKFLAECARIGNAGKVIAHTCYEPLLDVEISWLGQERFCYEVADNSDAVMELHEALAENHKKMYEVVASSPADYVLYGGNVVPESAGAGPRTRLCLPLLECLCGPASRAGQEDRSALGCQQPANSGCGSKQQARFRGSVHTAPGLQCLGGRGTGRVAGKAPVD